MALVIIGVLLLGAGIVLFVISNSARKKAKSRIGSYDSTPGDQLTEAMGGMGRIVAIALLAFGLILPLFGTVYTQDVGEAKVLRSFTGDIVGVDTNEGMAFKAPWVETVDFDVRNQQAIYKGEGYATSEGEFVNGPEITFQDQDKVSGNADVAIRYSIDPAKVGEIYQEYPTQQALTARLIDQDMRSVVRNVFAGYTTAGVLENRAQLELDITKGLTNRWNGNGVIVESVALQGIRYPQSTQEGFTQAQESATALKKAQADLKVREAEAQQKLVVAKADAEANRLLTASLTPEILQQQYNETLREISKNGDLVVVPEGSQPIVGTNRD